MKKVIYFAFAITAVLFLIAGYSIISRPPEEMTDSQKNKAITDILGRKPILSEAPTGDAVYYGKFATFSYPILAKIYTYRDAGLKNNTSVLESFSFDISNPRIVFNYAVFNTASLLTVEDISDVKFRELPQSGYVKKDIASDGKNGLSFERQGDTNEKSGFFLVKGRSYSFSVTGNNIKEVNNIFNNVIQSLKFNP